MPLARERFWEGVDLIVQAWTKPGPTSFEGKHYSMRYVNPWPQPLQTPHPPIWIPGSNSVETMYEVARRDFCYFLSTRGKLSGAKRSALRFGEVVDWRVDRVVHRWAGLRSFAPDRLPVYGFDTHEARFFWFAGQGGFGIQTAPAAAAIGAALLTGKDIAPVNPQPFAPSRFS